MPQTARITTHYPADNAAHLIDRARKDPAFAAPGEPFTFINLMQISASNATTFIADWKIRAQLMRQQQGALHSTLHQSVLPDARFRIVNLSHWQSYDAFIDANNHPEYATRLNSDEARTPSLKLVRGFYRPVAAWQRLYAPSVLLAARTTNTSA